VKVVYIAGPFSGATGWDVERNIRRAEELSLQVSCLGASPMCPHTNTRFFNGTHTYEFWIAATSALLSKCDAVIFTPDWHKSSGARKEHEQALRESIPVFYDLDTLGAWLSEPRYFEPQPIEPPLHGG
jgi:hypothetical protein